MRDRGASAAAAEEEDARAQEVEWHIQDQALCSHAWKEVAWKVPFSRTCRGGHSKSQQERIMTADREAERFWVSNIEANGCVIEEHRSHPTQGRRHAPSGGMGEGGGAYTAWLHGAPLVWGDAFVPSGSCYKMACPATVSPMPPPRSLHHLHCTRPPLHRLYEGAKRASPEEKRSMNKVTRITSSDSSFRR